MASSSSDTASRTPDDLFQEECLPLTTTCDADTGHKTRLLTTSIDLNSEQNSSLLPSLSSKVPTQDSPSLLESSTNVPERDSLSLFEPSKSSDVPKLDSPSLPAPSSDVPGQDSPSFPAPSRDVPGQDSPSLPAPSSDGPGQESPSLPALSSDGPGQESPSLPALSSDGPGQDSPSLPEPQDSPSLPEPSSDVTGQDSPSLPAPSSDIPGQNSPSLPAPSSDIPGQNSPSLPAPSRDGPRQDSSLLPEPSSDVPGQDSPSLPAPSSNVPGQDIPSLPAQSSDVPGPDSPSLSAASSDVPGQDGPSPSAPSNDVPGPDSPSLLPSSCDVPRQDSPSLPAPSSDVPGPDRPLDPVTSDDFTGKDSPLLSATASSNDDTGEDMIGLTALATSDGAPGQDSSPASEPGISYMGLKDPPCIANSGDTGKDCGELAAYNDSDTKQSCLFPEAAAINASVKTKSSQEPHVTPPLDCRPKVFPGTSKSSSAESEERNTKVTLSFECDENFECEVLEGDEEAANSRWENCKKNPGHKKFIPVKDFSIEHLPETYRKKVFIKGIKSVAKLTVRLRVGFTSAKRPDHDYFSWCRGTNLKRMGSGFVCTSFANSSICGLEVPEGCLSEADEDRGLRAHCEAKYCDFTSSKDFSLNLVKCLNPTLIGPEFHKYFHAIQAAVAINGPNFLTKNLETIMEECFDFSVNDGTDDWNNDQIICDLVARNRLMLLGVDSSGLLQNVSSEYPVHVWRKTLSHLKTKRFELMFGSYTRLERELTCLKRYYDTIEEFLGSIADEDDDSYEYDDYSFEDFQRECYKETFNTEDDAVEDEEDAKEEKEEEKREEIKGNGKDNNDDNSNSYSQTFIVKHPCPCPECAKSNNPKQEGYIMTVMTARHIVFDKEEAQNTIVELFCDDESGEGVVQLPVVDVGVYSNVGDFTLLMCATHDRRLFLKVSAMLAEMTDNVKRMKTESNTPLAVICSHPHGNFKHITVGEWTTRYIHQRFNFVMSLWTSYLYNTATCPGSSGAPVLILGYKDGTLALDSPFHPHHGTDDQGQNKSTRFYSAEAEMKKMCPEAKQRVLKERREFRRKTLEDGERVWKEFLKITSNLDKYVSNVKSRSQCWKDDFVRNLLYFITLKDDENASGCINELINITHEER